MEVYGCKSPYLKWINEETKVRVDTRWWVGRKNKTFLDPITSSPRQTYASTFISSDYELKMRSPRGSEENGGANDREGRLRNCGRVGDAVQGRERRGVENVRGKALSSQERERPSVTTREILDPDKALVRELPLCDCYEIPINNK
ncbi:hypothetical protein KM043_004012 [Ampulex compressa]|nr:hypothetical protein KM043_004012 [Ampulex compressa]